MGTEYFSLPTLIKLIKSRRCAKRHPWNFWGSFGLGVFTAIFGIATVIAWLEGSQPFYRPTLQLAKAVVPQGGNLEFVQAAASPRKCPQETQRVVWWWEDGSQQRRLVVSLSDAPPPPRVWDGPTLVSVALPPSLPPGKYYYLRETQTWCSWFNVLLNRPVVERTPDVPFEIVPTRG